MLKAAIAIQIVRFLKNVFFSESEKVATLLYTLYEINLFPQDVFFFTEVVFFFKNCQQILNLEKLGNFWKKKCLS